MKQKKLNGTKNRQNNETIKKDDDGNCIYCGQKCWEGELCDEQQAGGFNDKDTRMSPKGGIQVVSFDFPGLLQRLTNKKNWKETTGPDSRVGLDYWYKSGKSEANINLDQGEISVAIDGETIFSGTAEEA